MAALCNLVGWLLVGLILRGVWLEELKFNSLCSNFVLFEKKFPIIE
jgi:hypothetical protein